MTATHWILIGVALLLMAYDIFAYVKNGELTISMTLWKLAQKYPIVAFGFGVLMGHLFWVQCGACG